MFWSCYDNIFPTHVRGPIKLFILEEKLGDEIFDFFYINVNKNIGDQIDIFLKYGIYKNDRIIAILPVI